MANPINPVAKVALKALSILHSNLIFVRSVNAGHLEKMACPTNKTITIKTKEKKQHGRKNVCGNR